MNLYCSFVTPYFWRSARISFAALCSPASISTAALSVRISSLSPCPTSRKCTVQLPSPVPEEASPPKACCAVSVRYPSISSSAQPGRRSRESAVRVAVIFFGKMCGSFVVLHLLWILPGCFYACFPAVWHRVWIPVPPDSRAWFR